MKWIYLDYAMVQSQPIIRIRTTLPRGPVPFLREPRDLCRSGRVLGLEEEELADTSRGDEGNPGRWIGHSAQRLVAHPEQNRDPDALYT